MKAWQGVLAGTALLVAALTCTVVVDEAEHVVVTRFGRPVAVRSEAGLYLKAPAPIERVTRFDKRLLLILLGHEFRSCDHKSATHRVVGLLVADSPAAIIGFEDQTICN